MPRQEPTALEQRGKPDLAAPDQQTQGKGKQGLTVRAHHARMLAPDAPGHRDPSAALLEPEISAGMPRRCEAQTPASGALAHQG